MIDSRGRGGGGLGRGGGVGGGGRGLSMDSVKVITEVRAVALNFENYAFSGRTGPENAFFVAVFCFLFLFFPLPP